MSCTNSTNIFLLGLVSGMTSDIRASPIDHQQIMTFAYAFSLTLLVTFAIISNGLSIDTFRQRQIRSTTVGFYLIVHSCCSIFGIFMLECRLIRMSNYFTYTASFFICNVVSGLASIFTRICLWMNGFIAVQRSLHTFEPNPLLNKLRSRTAAPKQILIVILCISFMHIHELICRVSVPDPLLPGNFICQIKYPPPLLTMNTIFTFTHLLVPFALNILANLLVLTSISHRKATLHQTSYWAQWMRQFRRHRHLFLAPTLAVVCTVPQLTFSLLFTCVDISSKLVLRFNTAVNLITYLPQAATFLLFILPSETYFEMFKTQSYTSKLLFCCRRPNNIVAPLRTIDRTRMEARHTTNPMGTIELRQTA